MVAYPGVKGPVPTPTWEVIRDGINDYKYIFQLEKLISSAKERGRPKAVQIEKQLQQFKKNFGEAPKAGEDFFGDWHPDSFSKKREQIVEWALELFTEDEGPTMLN
jgi:hypothetical protein